MSAIISLEEARAQGIAVDYPANPAGEGAPVTGLFGQVVGYRRFAYVEIDSLGRGGWLHFGPDRVHIVPAPWARVSR